jgi:hypothetical protein
LPLRLNAQNCKLPAATNLVRAVAFYGLHQASNAAFSHAYEA